MRYLGISAFLLVALFAPRGLHAREFAVLTYNVENLFDADKVAIFEDYAETGEANAYSPSKLLEKLRTITKVLKSINGGLGPEVACFNEFELDFTPGSKVADYPAFLEKYKGTTVEKMLTGGLNDEIRGLPVEALLLKHLEDEGLKGYHVAVGGDQPDFAALAIQGRGVHKKGHKNALFSRFPIVATRSHATPDARDILEATLDVEGHPFTIFVNHWKSGAGDFGSEQTRRFNAKTLRDRLDQLLQNDPSADILIVGDFNSQYNQSQAYPFMGQTGVNDVLGSQGDEAATASGRGFSLYNLWYEIPREHRRSDQYDGKWGTLMQKMITPGLYDRNGIQYVDNSFQVVALDGINTRTPLKLPRRWSNAGQGSGASDHFPVSARFRTVEDGDRAGRLALDKPGTSDGSQELVRIGLETLRPGAIPEFSPRDAKNIEKSMGEFFLVKGKLISRKPLTVEVHGTEYGLWFLDPDLRKQAKKFPAESEMEFIGEFALHKGKLQFVVADPSWLLVRPGPAAP